MCFAQKLLSKVVLAQSEAAFLVSFVSFFQPAYPHWHCRSHQSEYISVPGDASDFFLASVPLKQVTSSCQTPQNEAGMESAWVTSRRAGVTGKARVTRSVAQVPGARPDGKAFSGPLLFGKG